MITEKANKRKKDTRFGGADDPCVKYRFGQPNANPSGNQSVAGKMRAFYAWVYTKATEKELSEYVKDNSNPAVCRKFVRVLLNTDKLQDYLAVSEHITGKPKQDIEITAPPKIEFVEL